MVTRYVKQFAFCIWFIGINLHVYAVTDQTDTRLRYVADELLVKFRPNVQTATARAMAVSHGAVATRGFKRPRKLTQSPLDQWMHVKIANGYSLAQAFRDFTKNPLVEKVELNYLRYADRVPNDPRFAELWGLHNTAQTGGTIDADIDAPEAWDTYTGSSNEVVVGVVDTGIDYRHEDLKASMWINPGEIPNNGKDDDGNGYIDDVYGYDFYDNDSDPMDTWGHGSHVAGTIAAAGNNGIGITGVSWKAKLMALKVFGTTGPAPDTAIFNALLYAIDMGVKITNNSYGSEMYSQAFVDILKTADAAGMLFVAAAGNRYSDNDVYPHFPASHDLGNIISVAATNASDLKAGFSNYGLTTTDLGAPGVDILSTLPVSAEPSGYRLASGTSMATPHVVGACALFKGRNPSLSAGALKALVMASTDPIPDLAGKTVTGGRLNINNAVKCTTAFNLAVDQPIPGFAAYRYEGQQIRATVYPCGTTSLAAGSSIRVNFSSNETSLMLYDDGNHGDGAAGDGVFGNTWIPTVTGPITLQIEANHPTHGRLTKMVNGNVQARFYGIEFTPMQWIDVTVGGTLQSSGVTLPIGFDFKFYGTSYTQFAISRYGYLVLGTSGIPNNVYINTSLPDPAAPNTLIAPFWDEFDPIKGRIYTLLQGTAPNRRLTVAWIDATFAQDCPEGICFDYGTGSFQVTLYEGSNDIVFQYLDVYFNELPPPMIQRSFGADATVGVENADGSQATLYSFNQRKLYEDVALRFKVNTPPTTPPPPPPPPSNQTPIADAGPDQTVKQSSQVTLNGSKSSDPDGSIVKYQWRVVSGKASLQNAGSAIATFTAPRTSKTIKLVFELTVTDNKGATASDQVTITVTK